MDTKTYIFSLDYGNRSEEKKFIKEVLRSFDTDTLVGCGIFVNNNPYSLEFLFFTSLVKELDRFDNFIKEHYNGKKRIFNYFLDDIFQAFVQRGYNGATFVDADEVDEIITDRENQIFLFPCKENLNRNWGGNGEMYIKSKVFLSYSSKDKEIVDKIFDEFQKNEICAWYDKYEIVPGDSITDKINEGLDESDIGIICISNNFLNGSSGWTKSELNFFVQRRMRNPEQSFIILNFDVSHDELPPLVQDYKYIDFNDKDAMDVLINTLRKKIKSC